MLRFDCCATYPGRAYVISIEGERVIAQFIVWPTGSMEATVIAAEDGETVHLEAEEALEESELDERWRRFCSAVTQETLIGSEVP